MSDDDIINTLQDSDFEIIIINNVCEALRAGNKQIEEKINNKKKLTKRKKSPKRSPKKSPKKTNLKNLSQEQNEENLSNDQKNNDSKFSFLSRGVDKALTSFMSNAYYEEAIQKTVDFQLQLAEEELNNCIKANFPENSFTDDENQKQNESPNRIQRTKAPTKSKKPGKKISKVVQSKKMIKKK